MSRDTVPNKCVIADVPGKSKQINQWMPGVTPCAAACTWMRVLYPWLRRFVDINYDVPLTC